MASETSTACSQGGLRQYAKVMMLPALFSACVWWIALHPSPMLPGLLPTTTSWQGNASSGREKNMIPDTLHDAFKLGEITMQMKSARAKDATRLLHQANDVLNHKEMYNLTLDDLIDGRLGAAIEGHCKRQTFYKLFRGLFSFVGVLSIISIVGILATLWPTLKILYRALHLDRLWRWLVASATWILDILSPIVDVLSMLIPLLVVDQSLHFTGKARSQLNILAAGFATLAFYYQIQKRQGTAFDISRRSSFATVAFVWGFTFLVPLALVGDSQFLGFFAVGSVFGALGFVAFPMPFGWVAGFQDELSMDKCMCTSILIISLSVVTKMSFPFWSAMKIFQLGLSVFGMLSFGLAGLIKSSHRSNDNDLFFGDKTSPITFIYPLAWLTLGLVGSLISYASLTNTAITFVGLWISQFYWRMTGVSSISIFFFSCTLFYLTLWLKTHQEFLESLLEI